MYNQKTSFAMTHIHCPVSNKFDVSGAIQF